MFKRKNKKTKNKNNNLYEIEGLYSNETKTLNPNNPLNIFMNFLSKNKISGIFFYPGYGTLATYHSSFDKVILLDRTKMELMLSEKEMEFEVEQSLFESKQKMFDEENKEDMENKKNKENRENKKNKFNYIG